MRGKEWEAVRIVDLGSNSKSLSDGAVLLCGVDSSGAIAPLRVGVPVSPQPAKALRIVLTGERKRRLRSRFILLCGTTSGATISPMNI